MPQAFSTPEPHSPACRSLTFDADGFLSAINRNPADRGGWVGGVVLKPVKRYEHLTGFCEIATRYAGDDWLVYGTVRTFNARAHNAEALRSSDLLNATSI